MNRVSHGALVLAATGALGLLPTNAQVVQVQLESHAATSHLTWRELAADPASDGKSPRLPDARSLAFAYDEKRDEVWFRIGLEASPPRSYVGLNLALDGDLDQANGTAWWGVQSGFRFDRLVTVWLRDVGDCYQGFVGVADSAMVAGGRFGTPLPARIRTARDEAGRFLFVGLARRELDVDGRFDVVATVGSSMMANDSVPDADPVRVEFALRRVLAIDDFEDDDVTALSGFAWRIYADDEWGGASTGGVKLFERGAGSGNALRLEGEVHPGKPSVVGAWAVLASTGLPADLRGYRGLRFRARGDGRRYTAGFFCAAADHFGLQTADFATTSEWRLVEITFDELEQTPASAEPSRWDGADAASVGFSTAAGYDGRFALEIDDVEIYPSEDVTP